MGLDASIFDDPEETRLILTKYFGKMAMIWLLRAEVSKVLPRSIIVEKILYNGIHCGDNLPVSILPAIEAEIHQVAAAGIQLPEVQKFLSDLSELVQFARQHQKPIVF